ncbi:MAG: hypothetical protein V2I54_03260 [Bacteroidales bacterium]|jgi:hypothetical protein|nr:hypothetical protein [Bacteroidales bacterium]
MLRLKLTILIFGGMLIHGMGYTQHFSTKGQFISGLTVNPKHPFQSQFRVQYFPTVFISKPLNDSYGFDWEFTLDSYAAYFFTDNSHELSGQIEPYRGWFGFSGNQLDLRVGLQKINFGSASLLRPLMWFDQLDPRDPLKLTDGVHAFLGRYYFLNNANVWFWFLAGNDELKGWERFATGKKQTELGGRIQFPFLSGEIAATYHYRDGSFKDSYADTLTERLFFSENRYAVDGKFDWLVGLWFETVLIHQNLDFSGQRYQRMMNYGLDYTFNVGNGLYVIAEYFSYSNASEILGTGNGADLLATSFSYPVNIINNIQAVVYYDLSHHDFYRFINFSWTYDNWIIYFMGFWNPENYQIYQDLGNIHLFSGYGAQVMVVFNH